VIYTQVFHNGCYGKSTTLLLSFLQLDYTAARVVAALGVGISVYSVRCWQGDKVTAALTASGYRR
jgi:hypothetical protein